MKTVYAIKKVMVNGSGKKTHVLMTDGMSEVMEIPHKNIAEKMVEVLNENSDSGWTYVLIEINYE